MAAAGLMFVKDGYTNFVPADTAVGSTGKSYGQTLTSEVDDTFDTTGATVKGQLTSTHREFGTADLIGNHGITADNTMMIENGPCVTCHMSDGHHTLAIDATAYTNICSNCHTAESGVALTADNFKTVFLEPNSEAFQAAITLAENVLTKNFNITYDPSAYPYFYDQDNGGSAVKNWTRGGALTAAQAEKLMGACFNINLLNREPAAFAHARTYSRRLLYDTIDWLDNKDLDFSVSQTALASGLKDASGNDLFRMGTVAYDGGAPYKGGTINASTSEAMTYILGWGYTGGWNTPERP